MCRLLEPELEVLLLPVVLLELDLLRISATFASMVCVSLTSNIIIQALVFSSFTPYSDSSRPAIFRTTLSTTITGKSPNYFYY